MNREMRPRRSGTAPSPSYPVDRSCAGIRLPGSPINE